ncbi:hypothetical protein [Xenorhabdus sp. PB30.3]|uniref:hypothetical protein n=1 Tax=Xenorhabdus sp. PB30.3 TaxID=2788941 RepID=UPI001E5B26F6|nr:hypothetical protein [Xenorhabdus sp. PB30.3]MCC8381954.1 hypothetical protein [Xenorhabdus sp. PB30.3]
MLFKTKDNKKITSKELGIYFQKHLLSYSKENEFQKQRNTQDRINIIMEFAKNNQLMLIIDNSMENEIIRTITSILDEENYNFINYCKMLINTYIGQDNFFWILIAICNKNEYFEKKFKNSNFAYIPSHIDVNNSDGDCDSDDSGYGDCGGGDGGGCD